MACQNVIHPSHSPEVSWAAELYFQAVVFQGHIDIGQCALHSVVIFQKLYCELVVAEVLTV